MNGVLDLSSLFEAELCSFPVPANPSRSEDAPFELGEIIRQRRLSAVFQPVVHMNSGEVAGFEGLIRGPDDSPLHTPGALFRAARDAGLLMEVERLCRLVVLESFVRLHLPGKLFLNVSPKCLLLHGKPCCAVLDFVAGSGVRPENIVIELTENEPASDYRRLIEIVGHYRRKGFGIAMDDLGEGFSSLRLWSELRPDYVKIDMHFIQGVNRDPVKLEFVRSIQKIAENSGCHVIAEGIETPAELLIVRDLGIAFGQGFHLAHPSPEPSGAVSAQAAQALAQRRLTVYPQPGQYLSQNGATAAKLLRPVKPAEPGTLNDEIYERFSADPELQVIPVVRDGVPVGLINRYSLIDRFARPFRRELFGKRPCTKFMDSSPVVVESLVGLQELSHIIVAADHHHLSNGFIITEHGRYLGMGSSHDLMREITHMQLVAARYANPLTLLPGNVPINEHIERLLRGGAGFCVCYADLDHFKPFNDVYGYRKGDEIIQLVAKILAAACDPQHDFIGHIGGDDFIILFQSPDWEPRCRAALKSFSEAMLHFFSREDLDRGGFMAEDRQGRKIFHPLTSLSLGVIRVGTGEYDSHRDISSAATEAKRQAKKIPGNSLFLGRRPPAPGNPRD